MSKAFHLSADGVATITLANPPVNALSAAVRTALLSGLQKALDVSPRAIVITGAGSAFCAGADIREFGSARVGPSAHEIQAAIESAPIPVIAHINGVAFGGGLELALSCHWRIGTKAARLALPEVKLGLLPGAGGTQRLTRLVGAQLGLELITFGAALDAARALELGVIDFLSSDQDADLSAFISDVVKRPDRLRQVRLLIDRIANVDPRVFADFRQELPPAARQVLAVENCIKCVEVACRLPFDEGLALERKLFAECHAHPQRAALIHVFFAERSASNLPDARGQKKPAVIGVTSPADETIRALATDIRRTGIDVLYEDESRDALSRCEVILDAGGLADGDATRRFVASPSLQALCSTEPQAVERDLPDSARQVSVGFCALPFANGNKYVELQRLGSAEQSIGIASTLAKLGGFLAIQTPYAKSFVALDLFAAFLNEAESLALDGAGLRDVDVAAEEYGFLAGPFHAADVFYGTRLDRKPGALQQRDATALPIRHALGAQGVTRAGQQPSYYAPAADGEDVSGAASAIIAELRRQRGIVERLVTKQEIVARLVGACVSACRALLDGGRVTKESDLDILCLGAIGFPRFRGGPIYQDTLTAARSGDAASAIPQTTEEGARFGARLKRHIGDGS